MIYYDNAATTQICHAAKDALLKSFEPELFGNPSAPHAHGLTASRALKSARKILSTAAGCQPEELLFTSGGTESNNLAILGAARLLRRKKNPLVLATNQEHSSVSEPLKHLQESGVAKVVFAAQEEWCRYEADMVCLPAVASETGDIFDINKPGNHFKPDAIVFVDGAQGFGKLKLSSTAVNLYSFSGHKFHAPKGVGGLVVRGVNLQPLFYGGGQQPLRSGTENVGGIMAMAAAYEFAAQPQHHQQAAAVKAIIASIARELPQVAVNSAENSSSYILNMSFGGIKSETMVNLLSSKKLYAGIGTACNSKRSAAKPLIQLLGEERASSAVRFSFSAYNTVDEAHAAKEIIMEAIITLRGAK